MGCSEKKLSKNLTQIFMVYCNVMICQQATLSGEAERPKVADAVIEATFLMVIDGSMHVLLTPNSQLSRKVSKNHFVTGGNRGILLANSKVSKWRP